MNCDDSLILADERDEGADLEYHATWRVLIVDDEESVHQVTRLSLESFRFAGRPLEFFHAYSGRESIEIMRSREDIAVVLMDVVMETDHAGLEAVKVIRNDLCNRFVRIVLRTGQSGQAPEHKVITEYDINDYKEKTELTSTKLFTVVYTAIASYRDLTALDANRKGLEKVIDASAQLLQKQSLANFSQDLLEQLATLMYYDKDAFLLRGRGLTALIDEAGELHLLAGMGKHAPDEHGHMRVKPDNVVMGLIREAVEKEVSIYGEDHFLHGFSTPSGVKHVVYLASDQTFSIADQNLIELFCRNAALCMENIELDQQMRHTQQELILMLSEAIERRSNEAGNHVRRVAEYAALLGTLAGMGEAEVEVLKSAAPLHDAGKIATPDAILNKPAPLDADEFEIMREHATIGRDIFARNRLPILQAASIICGQHHERWDGLGYPEGLEGDEISLIARIVALADVYDALSNKRCYKPPWPEADVITYLKKERGRHFDARLVDLLLNNIDRFREISVQLADNVDSGSLESLSPLFGEKVL